MPDPARHRYELRDARGRRYPGERLEGGSWHIMQYCRSRVLSLMDTSKYDDPARGTRRWITVGLAIGGALAGAAIGVALTPLGKIVAGAPPADLANYARNAAAFAAIGALAVPLVGWSLRRVPLWRTVVEPLAGALAGAGIGVLAGSGAAFLALIPVGGAVAALRLAFTHRDPVQVGKRLSERAK